jgi:signal transduction histidine kinase
MMNRWRTARFRHSGGPPPWWPRNEPWPPRDREFFREHRRNRFVRRTGWYSFWPIWLLVWWIVGRGRWGWTIGWPGGAIGLLVLCAAIAGFVAIVIRRVAEPIADVVSAADRIAHRDYQVRVRVPEFGPAWVGDTARAFNAMAKELEAQDTARRHLMADVAHELRTPLAIVQGKLEGLIDGIYARDDEQLQGLLEDTRVLARLVEDLRTLSTAESGALGLSKEPTDIVSLANDVVASLAARADEAGVALHVDTDATEIEPIVIDPLRIREVLTNLVVNALRYTPRGGRVVVGVSSRGTGIEVRVADTGAGISPADLPRIFDRFYKSAGSSGSGLGLTIARSLVEAHGGAIHAESRPGSGTTMVITLPH